MIATGPIIFTAHNHSYMCGDVPYKSVSSVFHQVDTDFDAEYTSLATCGLKILGKKIYDKAKKDFGWGSIALIDFFRNEIGADKMLSTQQDVIAEWSENNRIQTELGTAYHLHMEEKSKRLGHVCHPINGKRLPVVYVDIPEGVDNQSAVDDLRDLPDGYYPELLIHDHEYKVAGQSDSVFLYTHYNVRYASFDDFKTDKEIRDRGFFNFKTKQYSRLKAPLDLYEDCEINKYTLKISLYALMMERAGYVIGPLSITWADKSKPELPFDDWTTKLFELRYQRKAAQTLLDLTKVDLTLAF